MKIKQVLTALAVALGAGLGQAACMSDAEVAALMDAYTKRQPAANPEGLSGADGECSREKVLKLLQSQMGAPVGYKAGLTNPAVQKRFEHDAPVWGMLFAPMLLKNAAIVDAAFGARPLFEADLLVRVSDEAINRGKGGDVMGHPLNAVVWLAKDLARSGRSMKKGELISLGSFSRLLPPKAGMAVEVVYQGLPGNPVVGLSFK